jgi:hypothetical protein
MTWDDLRMLRAQGLKPSLPVMVATSPGRLGRLLDGEGFAVLQVKSGEPFHAELLDDLDVLLFLGSCDRASAVAKAMQAKAVKPKRLRTWCPCFERLDSQPVRCEIAKEWG